MLRRNGERLTPQSGRAGRSPSDRRRLPVPHRSGPRGRARTRCLNVTLLFSREQYEAAAEAYLRGLERRLSAELSLNVHSVAAMGCTISLVGAEAPAKSK